MDDNARAFARNMFRLRVHEANGQAYEDLFVKVMQYASTTFRPVKAHGKVGDRKNDGFDSADGTYYQVYAPKDVRKTQGDALKKLQRDFRGLKAFWDGIHPVRSYFFVINDKYEGVHPNIEQELSTIGEKHRLARCEPLLAHHIEARLFELSDDKIISIVGHVPTIRPDEFLFLSGFTYFVGAWIEFERTVRNLVAPHPQGRPHPIGRTVIPALHANKLIDTGQRERLLALNKARNDLVHGNTRDLPQKAEIDWLVEATNRLKGQPVLGTR
jgi:hypothetical protein